MAAEIPEFIRKLPEADLPVENLRAWMSRGEEGLTLFFEAEAEVIVPEHSHGFQWGVVVDGSLELTIEGETRSYHPGDTFFISSGAKHSGVLSRGYRSVEFFEDRDRFKAKST